MDGHRIKRVTNEGLFYLDDHDEEQFIDFALCHRNHIESHSTPEALQFAKTANNMTDDALREHIVDLNDWKVVANRNFDGYPDSLNPYIEFYTQPPIRFNFQTREEFELIRRAIHKAGWRTFDIT